MSWIVLGLSIDSAIAQMDTAVLAGRIVDSAGVPIAAARVELTDTDRNLKSVAHTTKSGLYVFPAVVPGHYKVVVSAPGFKTVTIDGLKLSTQDSGDENVRLPVGSPLETVIIDASGTRVETTGSVSTVVDRELVGELPLNGRSFQTLFQLTPGAVITPTNFASQGQFSVNGQRTDTNYLIVDGVSANFAIAAGASPSQSAGGSLPALSVFGSTNSLISVDDVQEFSLLTSSYSAEFGRVPGAQVSVVSRSGTNRLTGSVFEYLRNEDLEANDWFANNENLPRAPLRQGDFGGVVGGPVVKDKTFFFASFEGLELRQPTSRVTDVPSETARASAPAEIKPFLEAYPLPNGSDIGNGLSQATYGFSNPSSLRTFSLRVDHHFSEALGIFARFVDSTSDGEQRGAGSTSLSTLTDTRFTSQSLTAGVAYSITPKLSTDLRFNWSQSSAASRNQLDNFGGAIPLGAGLLFPPGVDERTSLFQFSPTATPQNLELVLGPIATNSQSQTNLVYDVAFQDRDHLLKFGVDFRFLSPEMKPPVYTQQDLSADVQSALEGRALFAIVVANAPVHAAFRNYSAYAQDTWRPHGRLSATMGVRWDYAPAPIGYGTNGLQPFAVTGFNFLPSLSLARRGTSLYEAPADNFGPRVGIAYELRNSPANASVLRAGAGVYYDTSNGAAGNAFSGISFPFSATNVFLGSPFPLSGTAASPPAITANPPFGLIQAFPQVLKTPYVYQWNAAVDQALGALQRLNISYIGAVGHGLLRTEQYFGGEAGVPLAFGQLLFTNNGGYSNYNSLQVKFERRSKRVHLLGSYCLSHSLDNVSTDTILNAIPARFLSPRVNYGPSDFDHRHIATAGLDYEVPPVTRSTTFLKSIFRDWSIDPITVMRSSPPVDVVVLRQIGPGFFDFRPNLVPSVPLYVEDTSAPGGRRINPASLSIPAVQQQGDLGRNFFRGFPLFQTDIALRRRFPITERLDLQGRIEVFNIFNHPNFAPPAGQFGSVGANGNFVSQPDFGISQSTMAQGLQGGGSPGSGFSPLYQIGGARSLQLSLRIVF